jgi:sulfotransferase family protein
LPIFRFSKLLSEQRTKIKSKRRELSQINKELGAAEDKAERSRYRKRKQAIQQEIFELERELRAAREGAEAEPVTGALPDFVIIGGKKCGTTYLYHLLSQHPLVEPASSKELHFFNSFFDEGIEWYRRCFPVPRMKDGRSTITGEGTPEYLSYPPAPARMAKVVPQARLIALLRNPVDRTYSDYQMTVRKGRETRSFEEILEAKKLRRPSKEDEPPERSDGLNLQATRRKVLSKSIYVDQLLRWAEFFPKEQLLVLKSEDFFEDPVESLKPVLSFLDLPEWKPKVWDLHYKRNKGTYEEKMDPATRRRLEEYFEPHNRRLYDFLGTDFGW